MHPILSSIAVAVVAGCFAVLRDVLRRRAERRLRAVAPPLEISVSLKIRLGRSPAPGIPCYNLGVPHSHAPALPHRIKTMKKSPSRKNG
jgi:hypothetical protein